MDSRWLIGGACVAAGAAVLFYLADDGKGAQTLTQPLRRDQLLEILKDIKKETSSAFITLAGFALSIKEQTQGRIADEYVREILSSQSPLNEQIKRAEMKVYSKYDVSEEQVKQAYLVDFKNDQYTLYREIQRLGKDMQDSMENAYRGIAPTAEAQLPDFLTSEKVLDVLKDLYNASTKVTFHRLEDLRRKGIRPNPYDSQFVAATQMMEAEVEEAKEEIYMKHGLGDLEDPASLVFNKAVQTYSHNPHFMREMMRLENNYKSKMQGIMMGSVEVMGESAAEEEEKVIEQVHTAMVGVEERLAEEELSHVGRAKVEELPDDS